MNNRSRFTKNFKPNVQVGAGHYDFAKYMGKTRWVSVWHQLDEILGRTPENVLEVGTGSGLLGLLLRHYGVNYVSVDIDPALNPDFVASVTDLPVPDNTFSVVGCFQVLEHLPYDLFASALSEIARVANDRVIISLPDAYPLWRYMAHLPKLGTVSTSLPRPWWQLRPHVFDGEHYWEINKRGYPLQKIVSDIEAAGLSVERTFRVFENSYHRFFVCKPDG